MTMLATVRGAERHFFYNEIAAIECMSNLPDDPELAIAAGRGLRANLLEPLQAIVGRLSVMRAAISAYFRRFPPLDLFMDCDGSHLSLLIEGVLPP
jgi:hypothetical protein